MPFNFPNLVGYNNVLLKGNKMNLLCVSWETIGNNNHKATLNEVMDTSKLTSYSEDGETPGDYINAWDMEAGNWGKIYYYVNQPSWNEGEYDWTDTWCDGETMPVDSTTIPAGSGFWYYACGEGTTFTFTEIK